MKFTGIILSFDDIVTLLADCNGNLGWMELDRLSDRKWTKEEIESKFDTKLSTETVCWEDKLAADLMEGESIVIVDLYEEDEQDAVHTLSLKDFVDGAKFMANNYAWNLANILQEHSDINDMDIFIQCATFGAAIYG